MFVLQQLQRENMALQALLETQQRQNELLKQSLQQQQPSQTLLTPHPASLLGGGSSVPVTVSHMSTSAFSPTVINVGAPGAPVAPLPPPAAAATLRPAVFPTGAAITSVATIDVNGPNQFLTAGRVSSTAGDARPRSRSPASDRQVSDLTQRGVDVVDAVDNPANVQVVETVSVPCGSIIIFIIIITSTNQSFILLRNLLGLYHDGHSNENVKNYLN